MPNLDLLELSHSTANSPSPFDICCRPGPLLDNPVILSARRCADDAMLVRTDPPPRAEAYEVRLGTMPGIWRSAGIYKAEPEIRIEGLSPGLEYSVAARALGAEGVSAWSDQAVCELSRNARALS